MAYRRKTTAESNGTIVIGIMFKNLIPDFCIFYPLSFAESKRRFRCSIGNMPNSTGNIDNTLLVKVNMHRTNI